MEFIHLDHIKKPFDNPLTSVISHHALVVKEPNGNLMIIHFSNTGIHYDFLHEEVASQYSLVKRFAGTLVEKQCAERRIEIAKSPEGFYRFETYDVAKWNCEHFVNWLLTGQGKSLQIEIVKHIASAGMASYAIWKGNSFENAFRLYRTTYNKAGNIADTGICKVINGCVASSDLK